MHPARRVHRRYRWRMPEWPGWCLGTLAVCAEVWVLAAVLRAVIGR